jgi:hypothetical protein
LSFRGSHQPGPDLLATPWIQVAAENMVDVPMGCMTKIFERAETPDFS